MTDIVWGPKTSFYRDRHEYCDTCEKSHYPLIRVGQDYDEYERTNTATVCEPCLRAALADLDQEKAKRLEEATSAD